MIDFLPVLEENLAAMRVAKVENMKDIFDTNDPIEAAIEIYEDLIEIYKHKTKTAKWDDCRCDVEHHYCFVHHKWANK